MKREARRFIRRHRRLFGLLDWKVELDLLDPEDRSCFGMMQGDSATRTATVYLHPDLEDEDIESTVLHELVHLVLADFALFASTLATTEAEEKWIDLLEERVVRQLEAALCELGGIPCNSREEV